MCMSVTAAATAAAGGDCDVITRPFITLSFSHRPTTVRAT